MVGCFQYFEVLWRKTNPAPMEGTMVFRYHQGLPYAVNVEEKNDCGLPGYIGLVDTESIDVGLNAPLRIESWPQFRIGTSLWPCGALLARALASNHILLDKPIRNSRVCELGAGVGLPSLVCGKMGASDVCITDYDDIVPLIEKNIALNAPYAGVMTAKVLDWSNAEVSELANVPWDFVLAADVVYAEEQEPLLDAIRCVCHDETKFILAYRERSYADRQYLEERILVAFVSVIKENIAFDDDNKCEVYICSGIRK